MHTWIALLRGINIGGRNILPMADLTRILESLRLQNIRTYIQSGNAVFESTRKVPRRLSNQIADKIHLDRGFRPQVVVLGAGELRQAVAGNPFSEAAAEPKTLNLFFLTSLPSAADIVSLDRVKASSERFLLSGRFFYLHTPDGFGKSRLAGQVERHLGVPATARNWRTVEKLMEMSEAK
jgi:uncharacterized protein (DUF1697 family)